MAMKLVILVMFMLGIVHTAPTEPVSLQNKSSAPSTWFWDFMEDVCDRVTPRACYNRDGYMLRYSVFDPSTRFCVCDASPSTFMINKHCPNVVCPADRPVPYYWHHGDLCFCEIDNFFAGSWNNVLPGKEPANMTASKSIFNVEMNEILLHRNNKGNSLEESQIMYDALCAVAFSKFNAKLAEASTATPSTTNMKELLKRQDGPDTTAPVSPNETSLPSFVPPPKKDITPELIEQSLAIQPENTATVSSVIPHFADDVTTFLMQLSGIVANTIAMNASTTFPCGTIGTDPEPNIMLVPKHVRNGVPQTTVADCRCIAVNMIKPEVINYWIQKGNSTISLVGDNKVYDIDKIDTTQPIALTMLTAPSGPTKRQDSQVSRAVPLPRRQVLMAEVWYSMCPEGMDRVPGNLSAVPRETGCLARKGDNFDDLAARSLRHPDAYSATMTKEACDAMKCTNNGDQPAMFNPFTKTCWCADPVVVEDNPSAWTGGKL